MQRSEIRLAGDTICRPFAPDGDFRHVPSPGQLNVRICYSVMTREEGKHAAEESLQRGVKRLKQVWLRRESVSL
jgi:hypothetical protein